MTTSIDEPTAVLVTLRGGVVIDARVVCRLLELEDRGCLFALLATGKFRVTPGALLTEDDRTFLKTNRDAIEAILHYDADSQPH